MESPRPGLGHVTQSPRPGLGHVTQSPRAGLGHVTQSPRPGLGHGQLDPRSDHLAVAPAHVFVYFWPDFTITSTPKKTPNKPKKETLGVYIVLKHTYY